MTREEAVAIAERFVAAEGLRVGTVRVAHFFSGAEYDATKPPPHWGVYFWKDKPVESPPEDMAGTCLCIVVDDISGQVRLVWWL